MSYTTVYRVCGPQVFNELDNRDEADMLTLAAFFQTVCGTSTQDIQMCDMCVHAIICHYM